MDSSFFQTIEDHFVRLRGAPLILSPGDWHVAAGWWERRIPLPVILRAIDGVFEAAAARGRGPIRSLGYCRHAVEQEFGRHVELSLGVPAEGGRPGPGQASALERVRARLGRLAEVRDASSAPVREALEQALAAIENGLTALEAGKVSPAATETLLLEHEDSIARALLEGLPPDEREALDELCDRRVAPYRAQMTAEALAGTLRRCRQTEVRRRCRLPRLSLLVD